MDDDLLESEVDFDVICNVVSILPVEYDVWSEVTDGEDVFDEPEMADVMNNECVEEQQAMFEKPDEGMKN
ncbi:hypothetical protein A2U01_0086139, partial [Trifolium medium]|nr:hypothetical protein [Trifolium medium]